MDVDLHFSGQKVWVVEKITYLCSVTRTPSAGKGATFHSYSLPDKRFGFPEV